MRSAVVLAAAVLAALSWGCQSGAVTGIQFSDDGNVVAFHDEMYQDVYVADERGVRRLQQRGEYVLSPDGRWLLVMANSAYLFGLAHQTGDTLTLLEMASGRCHTTRLPVNIPRNLVVAPEHRHPCAVDKVQELDALREAQQVAIWFGDEAAVTIGPIWDEYWCWHPGRSFDEEWSRVSAADWVGNQTPASHSCLLNRGDAGYRWMALFPGDGWIAARTVWIRPDGSVLELSRKNDALLLFLYAVYGPVAEGIEFAGAAAMPAIAKPAAAVFLAFLAAPSAWQYAFSSLSIDRRGCEIARDRLRTMIEERRRTTGDQLALQE